MTKARVPLPAELAARKVRFGLVGCGRIAERHVEAIAAHGEQAELVAVADTDGRALAAVGNGRGCPRSAP